MKVVMNILNEYFCLREKILYYYYAIFNYEYNTSFEKKCNVIKSNDKEIDEMYKMYFELNNSNKLFDVVNELLLKANELKLDKKLVFELTQIKNRILNNQSIPIELNVEYQKAKIKTEKLWNHLRTDNAFSYLVSDFERLISLKKELFNLNRSNVYDNILSSREAGTNQLFYDQLFNTIKSYVIPIYQTGSNKNIELNRHYYSPIQKQKEMLFKFANVFLLEPSKLTINFGNTSFMDNFGNNDIRLSLNIYENDIFSTLYEGIHEFGHALYEMQVDSRLNQTFSWGGASTALHESQAKLFENNIAHSPNFWLANIDYFRNIVGIKNLSYENICKSITSINNNLIRVKSDEVSFAIHIMIRYEIEKLIFNNEIKIIDLPKVWNELYFKYMNMNLNNKNNFILQDSHWFRGDFGYFPTYVLGSAYACQMYNKMADDINVDFCIESNNYYPINEWLKYSLHFFGSTDTPQNIFENCVGERFDSKYYIKYLKKRYGGDKI